MHGAHDSPGVGSSAQYPAGSHARQCRHPADLSTPRCVQNAQASPAFAPAGESVPGGHGSHSLN